MEFSAEPTHPQMKHALVLHLPCVHRLPYETFPILHGVTSYQGEEEASKYVDRLGGLGRQGGGGDMGEIFVYSQLKHLLPLSIVLTCSEVRHAV